MSYEIIDFHTHPFTVDNNNICNHIEHCNMSPETTREIYDKMGISRICGSVIVKKRDYEKYPTNWDITHANNETVMALWEMYGDFYIPGIQVHPEAVRESCEEIERMHKRGVRLIGELVPYLDCWNGGYDSKEVDEIVDVAKMYNMVVSVHPMGEDDLDNFVRRHPDLVIVGAHPGEYGEFMRHLERMKLSDNYYLDTSGYGIFRHGVLRRGIDEFGAERFVFGSDYPTCNPAMYLGGVKDDPLLTDREKELILGENAKRLLGL